MAQNLINVITDTEYFAFVITLGFYFLFYKWQKRTGCPLLNPLLCTTAVIIAILLSFHIPYENYKIGGEFIQLWMSPVTAVLAVKIYRQREILKENFIPVTVGCALGSLTSIGCVTVLCHVFDVDNMLRYSLIPKSITAPFAISVSEQLGGTPSLTIAAVVITGLAGMFLAPFLIRVFHIKNRFAAGIGIGTCSHAFGTSKAIELGEIEGAASSVAIGITGIITVIFVTVLPIV